MRRYLIAFTLLLALLAVALYQQPITATAPAGTTNDYLPMISKAPTPTPSPTVVPSPTPIVGSGVFKKVGSTIYHAESQDYTGACGFIHFASGEPAYGGPNGFRAEVCVDVLGGQCFLSDPVDATGYWELPIADEQLDTGGTVYAVQGPRTAPERVSRGWGFDTTDGGTLFRMDFQECTQNDTSSSCQLGFAGGESAQADAVELVPDRYCPPR